MLSKVVAFLALISVAPAAAVDIDIQWSIKPYADKNVNVGDKVTFTFPVNAHNAYIHPSGTCDQTDRILVASETAGAGSYTFTEADAGKTVTIACDFNGHCAAGQIIKFIVAAAATGTTEPGPKFVFDNWNIGNAPYHDRHAVVGDSALWYYKGSHNVYIYNLATQEDPCNNATGSTLELGPTNKVDGVINNVTYTFTSDDAVKTEVWFVCAWNNHCNRSQYVRFFVYNDASELPPTEAPSASPTLGPTNKTDCEGHSHSSHDSAEGCEDSSHSSHDSASLPSFKLALAVLFGAVATLI